MLATGATAITSIINLNDEKWFMKNEDSWTIKFTVFMMIFSYFFVLFMLYMRGEFEMSTLISPAIGAPLAILCCALVSKLIHKISKCLANNLMDHLLNRKEVE